MRLKAILIIAITSIFIVGCSENVDPNEPVGFIQIKGSDTIVNAAQKAGIKQTKNIG